MNDYSKWEKDILKEFNIDEALGDLLIDVPDDVSEDFCINLADSLFSFKERIRQKVLAEVEAFYIEENSSPCMKCGTQSCAICGYDFLNFLHKLKDKRRSH